MTPPTAIRNCLKTKAKKQIQELANQLESVLQGLSNDSQSEPIEPSPDQTESPHHSPPAQAPHTRPAVDADQCLALSARLAQYAASVQSSPNHLAAVEQARVRLEVLI